MLISQSDVKIHTDRSTHHWDPRQRGPVYKNIYIDQSEKRAFTCEGIGEISTTLIIHYRLRASKMESQFNISLSTLISYL